MDPMQQLAKELKGRGIKVSYYKPSPEFLFGHHGHVSRVQLRSPFAKMNFMMFIADNNIAKMFINKSISRYNTDVPIINIYSEEQTKKAFDVFIGVAEKLKELEDFLGNQNEK